MEKVKCLSLILLAVYLVFHGLADMSGFHLTTAVNFLLGLTAITSGVLMLLSVGHYEHNCNQQKNCK